MRPGRNFIRILAFAIAFVMTTGAAVLAQDETEDEVKADKSPVVRETIVTTGFKRDYLNTTAQSAVGLALPILETPAAISVVTQDILQDQQVNNVDDALRNVAAVTKFKTGNGGEEKFSIRGFDASQSIYKDGARINNALNASNIPSTETANIERIEVLKGPAGLIYGQGEPGGVINYVTKKPQLDPYYSAEAIAGNYDFYKLEVDATGRLGNSDRFAFRLVGAYENSDSFRDEVERERVLLNPTVSAFFGNRSSVTLGFEYLNDEYTQDRGQVLDGDTVAGYFYNEDIQDETQFYGIPDWNRDTKAESMRYYALIDLTLTDFWRVEISASRTENDKTNVDSSPLPVFANSGVIGSLSDFFQANVGVPLTGAGDFTDVVFIQPRQTVGKGTANQVKVSNFLNFSTGGIEHELLASFSFESKRTENQSFRGDNNVIFNLLTEEYFVADFSAIPGALADGILEPGEVLGPVDFGLRDRGFSLADKTEEYGINLIDLIRLTDQWSVLAGFRYSDFNNILRPSGDDTNFSFRGGIVYEPVEDMSFYASFAEGYTPTVLLGVDENPVDPETSKSWEIGAKFLLNDGRLLITAAAFIMDLKGVPFVTNPGAPVAEQRYENAGRISSDGFEIEVTGQITENWRIQAGYAFLDTKIAEGGTGEFGSVFPTGNRINGVPKHSFNLFTIYEWEIANAGTFGFGGGIFYQDDVFISTENNARYKSFVQVDLVTYYKTDRWKAQLNIKNLLDQDARQAQALTTTDTFAGIRVGTINPLTVTGSIAVEF